jgi:hypothetical protein
MLNVDSDGFYLSSTGDGSYYAYSLDCYSGNLSVSYYYRNGGLQVRCVK